MKFHSNAFTSTAPGWYRMAIVVWYIAAAAMLLFMVGGWMSHRLGHTRWRRWCGLGWAIAATTFLVPILVTSCST